MARGRPPHPDVLTPRQWEVLDLVREGRSNGEIGRELGISADGAKFHVSEILTKLGVSSRREAAEWQGRPAEERQPAPSASLVHMRTRGHGYRRAPRLQTRRYGRHGCGRSALPSILQRPALIHGAVAVLEAA